MKTFLFQGTCTALATPMTRDGIDFDGLKKFVNWQIAQGVSAVLACGTTGEPSTMTDDEWAQTVQTVLDAANGRVPVIAGTGGNNTAHVLHLAKKAKQLGASAQLCVTPYYNKTTQSGLIAHYSAIAEAGSLPVIIYNVPSRTGLNMEAETLAALSSHEIIIAMKEASGDMIRLGDMMRMCDGNIVFYSGTDEVIVPFMALGGQGVISVLSNIAPAMTCSMTGKMLSGDMKGAAGMQLELLPLIHALFCETSPIPVKFGMSLLGLCQNVLRLPLVPLSKKNEDILRLEMEKWKLPA